MIFVDIIFSNVIIRVGKVKIKSNYFFPGHVLSDTLSHFFVDYN